MAKHVPAHILGCLAFMLTLAFLFVGLSGCDVKKESSAELKGSTVTTTEKTPSPAEKSATGEEKTDEGKADKKQDDSQDREALKETLHQWDKKWTLDEKDKKAETSPAANEAKNDKPEVPEPEVTEPELTEEEVVEVIEEPKVELGDPLVDDLDDFVPLQKNKAAWIGKKKKQIVMVGRVVQRNAPLEMFVCQKGTKEHESVLMVDTDAVLIHAALLRIGAEQGHPVQFQPEYKPATGTTITIDVVWKDAEGKIQKAKAQDWIQNAQTKKPLDHDWVFAGSSFWVDKETGEKLYLAKHGDFICVSNFPTAMLDLPIKSSDREDALLFQAWENRIPPLGTPVTIILTPKVEEKVKKEVKVKEKGTGK